MAIITALQVIAPMRAQAEPASPVVNIDAGRISGSLADGVRAFKGIPFAAPPVGKLRWRAPQPATPWPGVRSATAYGSDCMQLPERLSAPPAGVSPSEDCLYLNVWRPALLRGSRPVLVWIYGGGFVNGAASRANYDGTAFARKGVVFVSFNYRLGRFGFFAHPALTAANEGPLGNYGYLDQIAALKWVRRNIAAFGGDPHRVTLMGESAGGISVTDLMASPLAAGLFQRAIVMSGGGRATMGGRALHGGPAGQPSAEDIGVAFGRQAGIEGDGPAALAALRALPAAAVLGDLSVATIKVNGDPKAALTFAGGPIIDGRIKLASVDEAFRKGASARIPILLGVTSEDLGAPTALSKDELFASFGAAATAARSAYDPDGSRPAENLDAEVARDRLLVEPARYVAQQTAKWGQPAWLYRFSYVPTVMRGRWAGVPHGGDVPFFFDTPASQYGSALTENDKRIASIASAYIANFARTGNPNGGDLPIWVEYSRSTESILDIGARNAAGMVRDPTKTRIDVIQQSIHPY